MTTKRFTSYALVGSGRLATHLLFYLESLNLPIRTWSRRTDSFERLKDVVESSSHVLFAVKDMAIAELSEPFLKSSINSAKQLVHFSGALNVAGVHAAHPLMTFGANLEEPEWYTQIPFIVDSGQVLSELLPGLPNPSWPIDPNLRGLYHALASLAGNSAFLLWQNVGDEFEKSLGLPRELLQPFLLQTVRNATDSGTGNFTGPVARGDWTTVHKHLEALTARPDLTSAYRSFLTLAQSTGHKIPEAIL